MGEIEMAAAAAQTKPPRIVFPSIITAITTPSSHSSSPSHWCPALEFMLLCDWVLWRSVGGAEIIYIPGSVFCWSIQCIESKGIRTDANVYHTTINQAQRWFQWSKEMPQSTDTIILLWIRNDTNNDKQATINSRRCDRQCFQKSSWKRIQYLT